MKRKPDFLLVLAVFVITGVFLTMTLQASESAAPPASPAVAHGLR